MKFRHDTCRERHRHRRRGRQLPLSRCACRSGGCVGSGTPGDYGGRAGHRDPGLAACQGRLLIRSIARLGWHQPPSSLRYTSAACHVAPALPRRPTPTAVWACPLRSLTRGAVSAAALVGWDAAAVPPAHRWRGSVLRQVGATTPHLPHAAAGVGTTWVQSSRRLVRPGPPAVPSAIVRLHHIAPGRRRRRPDRRRRRRGSHGGGAGCGLYRRSEPRGGRRGGPGWPARRTAVGGGRWRRRCRRAPRTPQTGGRRPQSPGCAWCGRPAAGNQRRAGRVPVRCVPRVRPTGCRPPPWAGSGTLGRGRWRCSAGGASCPAA